MLQFRLLQLRQGSPQPRKVSARAELASRGENSGGATVQICRQHGVHVEKATEGTVKR